MSREVWGDPPDPEPDPCELCGEEIGYTKDCRLCTEFVRAETAENELSSLRTTLAHRLRILKSRPFYEDAKKENGVGLEFLMGVTLVSSIKGVLYPHENHPDLVEEAERTLLTSENAGICTRRNQAVLACTRTNPVHRYMIRSVRTVCSTVLYTRRLNVRAKKC